jgi:hypothetical protein
MNKSIKFSTLQKIAKSKGLEFVFDDSLQCYVLRDNITGMMLMEYANVTVRLITNVNIWREEFNKFRAQSFR